VKTTAAVTTTNVRALHRSPLVGLLKRSITRGTLGRPARRVVRESPEVAARSGKPLS
jgi:hypothetical protein